MMIKTKSVTLLNASFICSVIRNMYGADAELNDMRNLRIT